MNTVRDFLKKQRLLFEKREAKLERERLLNELEARNVELELFNNAISHDLKSPLITICGFAGILEKEAAAGHYDQLQRHTHRILAAGEKMKILLDNLTELSRISHSVHPTEVIDLRLLVDEALAMLAGPLGECNVAVEIVSELGLIRGSRLLIQKVMLNLLDNAVKYMGEQMTPCIRVGKRLEAGRTVYYVADNGIGIARAYHEKIFDLFERLDPSGVGTGMGLALVRRIVDIHGGRIWVESEGPGKGARFCFTLERECATDGEEHGREEITAGTASNSATSGLKRSTADNAQKRLVNGTRKR